MAREICPAGIVVTEGNNGLISAILASSGWDVSLYLYVMFVNFSLAYSASFRLLPPADSSSLQSKAFVKGWVVAKTWSHFLSSWKGTMEWTTQHHFVVKADSDMDELLKKRVPANTKKLPING